MVDLSTQSVDESLSKQGKGFSELIAVMEGFESWTLDSDPNIKRTIINWANEINESTISELNESQTKALTRIISFLSSGRAIKLLSDIDVLIPGIAARLLIQSNSIIADKNTADIRDAVVMRDRLVTLYQANLLQRLFSPERIEGIRNAVEQ